MSGLIRVGASGLNVAANIRRLRDVRRLSTTGLAAALKETGQPIPATGITKIEKGQRRVDVDDLVALARVLGVEPADLLAESPACRSCGGAPPNGFSCNTCGAS